MFGAISFCSNLFLGENALISRCLRTRKFILISKATQSVALLAASVATVVSFYTLAKDPTNPDRDLLLTIGSTGIAVTALSCCGCLYVFDFNRLLREGAQRKAVHEAGEDIASEAQSVRQDVRRFELAHHEIKQQIHSFEGQVTTSTKKIADLESELKLSHHYDSQFHQMQEKLDKESLELKKQIAVLNASLEHAETILSQTIKEKREALALLQSMESRTEELEDITFSQISKIAKSIVDDDIIRRLQTQVEVFSEEDPAGYLEVLKRLPDLESV